MGSKGIGAQRHPIIGTFYINSNRVPIRASSWSRDLVKYVERDGVNLSVPFCLYRKLFGRKGEALKKLSNLKI